MGWTGRRQGHGRGDLVSWPPNDGAAALVGAWRRQQLGRDVTPPSVPPHLQARPWRFVCECGTTWKVEDASAAVVDGAVVAPRRQCVGCGQFSTGHPITT
jgi:hypothetical protein